MWLYPANFATMDFEPTTTSTMSNQSWFGNYVDPFKLVAGQSATEGDLTLSMQSDGNLVLYHDGVAAWASGTHNWPSTCTTCYASFQSDGNLVLSGDGHGEDSPYWSTQTNGHPGAQLHLSDSAPYLSIVQGVEIYPAKNAGPSHFAPFNLLAGQSLIIGDLTLSMQSDGNLVVYHDGISQWASGTNNWPSTCTTCYASFQSDGNLVLYGSSGNGQYTPYWSTETNGHPGALLVLSDAVPYLSIVLKSTQLWP
jgi:glycerophosphoryl diester phosphodiesterase